MFPYLQALTEMKSNFNMRKIIAILVIMVVATTCHASPHFRGRMSTKRADLEDRQDADADAAVAKRTDLEDRQEVEML